MISLPGVYRILKILTISLGIITIPLSVYIGLCFFVENYHLAWGLLGIQVCICAIDYLIYWRMMEILSHHREEYDQAKQTVIQQQDEIKRLTGALDWERKQDKRH